MAQNLASLNLTPAEVTALSAAIKTIRTTMGTRAVSLTPDERRTLTKMGDKTRTFCTQAVAGLKTNSTSLPTDFDLAGLSQDFADYTSLEALQTDLASTVELIDDTLKALASDIMVNSILGVGFLKVMNKLKPSLDTLLSGLGAVRRKKAVKSKAKTAKQP